MVLGAASATIHDSSAPSKGYVYQSPLNVPATLTAVPPPAVQYVGLPALSAQPGALRQASARGYLASFPDGFSYVYDVQHPDADSSSRVELTRLLGARAIPVPVSIPATLPAGSLQTTTVPDATLRGAAASPVPTARYAQGYARTLTYGVPRSAPPPGSQQYFLTPSFAPSYGHPLAATSYGAPLGAPLAATSYGAPLGAPLAATAYGHPLGAPLAATSPYVGQEVFTAPFPAYSGSAGLVPAPYYSYFSR